MPLRVSRFTSGVTDAVPISLHEQYQWPSPISLYAYSNDFSTYAAGDWTVTSTNSGTSALTDGNGGLLLQTTGGTSTNYQANQLAKKSFYLTTGDRHWFWISFNLSDVAHTLFLAGWVDTLAGPMTPGSGIYFSKTDASTTLNLILNNASTTSTVPVGTIAAATTYSVGWYYNAASTPTIYVYSTIGLAATPQWEATVPFQGGVRVTSAGANAPSGIDLTNVPLATVGHTIGFGITTGASAAHTNTVDYVGAASQITARF